MPHRHALVLLVAALALAGCQAIPQPRLSVFDPAEYEPYDREGTGVVVGQAFLRLAGGGAMRAAGRTVYLRPVTSYSTEFFERSTLNYERLEPSDPRSHRFQRSTIADADGRFRFEGLPAGEYYVACYIEWEVPTGTYYGGVATRKEGGSAYGRVRVEEGQVASVVVTRP